MGCTINDFLDFEFTAQVQADSAGNALSKIITKMIKNQGFPFNVYSILYQACVISISGYGSEVFGFEEHPSTLKIHLRAARAFLGLLKNVASSGLISELDWLMPHFQSQIKMIQHFSRILKTPNNRLIKKIYFWDRYLNESNIITSWTNEIKSILYESNLQYVYDSQLIFPIQDAIKQLKESLMKIQQTRLQTECNNKPKLRTFVKFKDFNALPPHVYKSLSFIERKIISKTRLGVLPLRIETARYLRPALPEAQRLCYCNNNAVESEQHVIYSCVKYVALRQVWLAKLQKPDNFNDLEVAEKLKLTFNNPCNIKCTAQYLVDVMDLRRLLNDQY